MSSDESDYEDGQQGPEEMDGLAAEESVDDSDNNLMDQDDDEDDDELKVTAWGKKKNQFYNEEEGKQSDEEADFEEEEEAKIIQNLRKERLTEGEFFDTILDAKKSRLQVSADDELEEEGDDDSGPFNSKRLEQIRKLDDYEKYEIIKKESPELIGIINELSRNLKQIKYKYLPLLNFVRGQNIKSVQGKKYIETKFELLLSYCMNLAFYISLRKEGKSLKDHPILRKIMTMKNQIVKLKEVDKLVEKQADQLLRKVVSSQRLSTSHVEAENQKNDALAAKKRKLLNQFHANLESNHKPESKTLKQKIDKTNKKKVNAKKQAALEVAHDDEDELESQEQDPLLLVDDDEDEKTRLAFGSNKVGTLKQKKRASTSKHKAHDDEEDFDLDDLDDIELDDGDDLGDFDEPAPKSSGQPKKTKTLAEVLNKKKYQSMRREAEDKENGHEKVGDDVYRQIKKIKMDNKKLIELNKQKAHAAKFEHDNKRVEGADGVRGITNTMFRNKGLTRRRKKSDKNSRVKLRNKYEKAVKKLKSKGITFRDKSRGYEGEIFGIKAGVIRSTSLNTK